MSNTVKMALMVCGALVLLLGSFLTFVMLSGAPMHEVAFFKAFVAAPEDAGKDPGAPAPTSTAQAPTEPPKESEPKPSGKAISASMGALGAFMLPAPFSTQELEDLQKELLEGQKSLRERTSRIEARERALEEWEQSLEQRLEELNKLREMIVKRETELSLREEEAKRDLESSRSAEKQSWKELAKFFEEGDPTELAAKLVGFPPEDAVKILQSLGDERASEIVNALPADKYLTYLNAYRAQASKPK